MNYGYVIKNLVIEKYTLKDPRERAMMYAMSSQSVQKKIIRKKFRDGTRLMYKNVNHQ